MKPEFCGPNLLASSGTTITCTTGKFVITNLPYLYDNRSDRLLYTTGGSTSSVTINIDLGTNTIIDSVYLVNTNAKDLEVYVIKDLDTVTTIGEVSTFNLIQKYYPTSIFISGVSDSGFDINTYGIFSGAFRFSARFYLTTLMPTGYLRTLFVKGTDEDNYIGAWIGWQDSPNVVTLTFEGYLSGTSFSCYVNRDLSPNDWHEVVLQYDGSEVSINAAGSTIGSIGHTTVPNLSTILNSTDLLQIGYGFEDSNYYGYLDEIRISSVLSGFDATTSAYPTDANTTLLLHGTSLSGSTSFINFSTVSLNTTLIYSSTSNIYSSVFNNVSDSCKQVNVIINDTMASGEEKYIGELYVGNKILKLE